MPKDNSFHLQEYDAKTVIRALNIAYEKSRKAAVGNVRAPMIAEATDYALIAKSIVNHFPELSDLIKE